MRAIVLAAAGIAGCSLTDLDGLTGGDPQADGSSTDASTDGTTLDVHAPGEGGPTDGGVDAKADTATDAGTDAAPAFKIACRSLTCSAPSCCLSSNGVDASCKPSCAIFEIAVACDSQSDCQGNTVCCGQTSGGAMLSSSCTSTCTSPNVVLCDQAAPANTCGASTTCQGATALVPYPYCR